MVENILRVIRVAVLEVGSQFQPVGRHQGDLRFNALDDRRGRIGLVQEDLAIAEVRVEALQVVRLDIAVLSIVGADVGTRPHPTDFELGL